MTSPTVPPVPARPALAEGRAPVLAGIVLPALNLRTAVTSITPLLDELGRVFGFGTTMARVLGMLPSAAFAVFDSTPALSAKPQPLYRHSREGGNDGRWRDAANQRTGSSIWLAASGECQIRCVALR